MTAVRRPPTLPPIPQRIHPLSWRRPFFVWTPVAVLLALGWPALLVREQSGLLQLALIAGALGMAMSLIALGGAWALGRPPRTRTTVIRNVAWTGGVIAAAAPFLLVNVDAAHAGGLARSTPLAMAPLALLLGLPMSLFAGTVFAWVALVKPPPPRRANA
ncbi:MAG TPA: hypothetical protein VG943_03965 [Caulobacterales bacterium]|nr:hypothetical protein [Caulobacterales bacterium]